MNRSTATVLRYLLSLLAVIAAYLVRLTLERFFGPGLPTYVTFYPVIVLLALIAGRGPSLVATAATAIIAYGYLLAPHGASGAIEAIGLGIFVFMGIFLSLVASYYLRLRTRLNLLVDERTAALTQSNAQLQREGEQRRQTEISLAETRERNRSLAELLEAAEQPFAVAYPDGGLDYFNDAFERLTGYDRSELATINWVTSLTPPEWSAMEQLQLAELYRTGRAVRYEKEYCRKDGSRVPVELLVHLVQDELGAPRRLFSFVTDLTERKVAEAALQEANEGLLLSNADLVQQAEELARFNTDLRAAEERLRFHTENSPLAVVEWDADFTVIRWTGEAERTFGWSAAEVIGRPITDLQLVYAEDLPLVERTIKRLTEGGSRKVIASNRNYTRDGAVIHCIWHNTVLTDADGRMRSVMSLVQNVTEQALAEEEVARLNQDLQRRLDELEAIFQTVPVGLAIAEDQQGERIRGNAANERLLGLSGGSNLSLAHNASYRVVVDGRECDLLKLPMQRAVRGETVQGEIIEVVRPDGETVRLLCNAVPLYDEAGGSRGAVGAFLDITELKRSEERINLLAETAERMLTTISPQEEIDALCHKALTILDCQFFFNYLADSDSGRLHLNAAAGISDAEQERIAWLDYGVAVCGCAARDACRIVVEDVPNSGDDRVTLVASFGVTAYACHPLVADGEVLGTLSFGSCSRTVFSEDDLDLMKAITDMVAIAIERSRDRQKLQLAHAMLEKQVAERTRDLEEALQSLGIEMNERLQAVEELRQKERLLSQQSRLAAMGEMISNIAHQWRQPLNTLGLLIQQLPIFFDSPAFSKEFLVTTTGDAMKLIQHMSATIDDFRDFFRPEKEPTLFSIDHAIHQAVSLVDVGFRNQHLGVDVQTDGDPMVTGFPNEFSQVIMNIMLNARDALLEKGVADGVIRIRAGETNDRVHVVISDNAGGIPEETIDRIFEPYFTTKGPDRGTGIGLFMAKTIIEQNHGGRLTARNGQDGAEFLIEIDRGAYHARP